MSLIGPEGRKQLKLAARFASAGFELAMAIVVGYLGGRWLDEAFETEPILQYIGLLLGIVAGFRSLFSLARSAQAASEENQAPEPDDQDPDDPKPNA
jgi:ATP synthase protein I